MYISIRHTCFTCIYMYMHVHIYIYMYTFVYNDLWREKENCTCHLYVKFSVYEQRLRFFCMYIYIYYTHACLCTYVCVCVYIYTMHTYRCASKDEFRCIYCTKTLYAHVSLHVQIEVMNCARHISAQFLRVVSSEKNGLPVGAQSPQAAAIKLLRFERYPSVAASFLQEEEGAMMEFSEPSAIVQLILR